MQDNSYYLSRLKALKITPQEAERFHALSYDKHGNIEMYLRHFSGEYVHYIPKYGDAHQAYRRHKKTESRRSTFILQTDEADFQERLKIIRHAPAYLAKHPTKPKYKFPSKAMTGIGVLPMPTNVAIDNYTSGKKGGTVVLVEGYPKAISLAKNGIESVGINGISVYRICPGMLDYLRQREPDDLVILYDGDGRHLGKAKDGIHHDRRVKSFYNSARRFAEQFHKYGISGRLHWAAMTDEADGKGVDDVIEATDDGDGVAAALLSLKSSRYFDVMTLPKTTYQAKLKKLFSLGSVEAFYERYGDTIKDTPFLFGGLMYQLTHTKIPNSSLFDNDGITHSWIKCLSNPFAVDAERKKVTVQRYLDEKRGELEEILATSSRLMLDAPTGIGKTSFFLGHTTDDGKRKKGYFERHGYRGIVLVPYVISAKQLRRQGIGVMCGKMSPKAKMRALQHDVLVCTYDHIRNVGDLHSRIMVIDEFHNIVSQVGFRKNTLAAVDMATSMDTARQVVGISGTPPESFAAHRGFDFVQVLRTESNKIRISHMTADGGKVADTAAAVLLREDYADGKRRFMLFNNSAELENIRQLLVKQGKLKREDIAVITRSHIDDGEVDAYHEIVNNEMVSNAKLVLSTCILSEAINIKNKDVGRVFLVQVDDVDAVLQYLARFRRMSRIDAVSIRRRKDTPGRDFYLPTATSIALKMRQAERQAESLNDEITLHRAELRRIYGEFSDAIEAELATIEYRMSLYDFAKIDGGKAVVDELAIFESEKRRMSDGMSNTVYYSILDNCENIDFVGTYQGIPDTATAEAVKDMRTDVKEKRKADEAALLSLLQTDEAAVVRCLEAFYKKHENRKHGGLFKAYWDEVGNVASCPITTPLVSDKRMRRRVLQFIKLRLMMTTTDALTTLGANNASAVGKMLSRMRMRAAERVKRSRRKTAEMRTSMRADAAAEMRIKLGLKAKIADLLTDTVTVPIGTVLQTFEVATSTYLVNEDDGKTKRLPVIGWTRRKVIHTLSEFFEFDIKAEMVHFRDDSCTREMCAFLDENKPPDYGKLLKIILLM